MEKQTRKKNVRVRSEPLVRAFRKRKAVRLSAVEQTAKDINTIRRALRDLFT